MRHEDGTPARGAVVTLDPVDGEAFNRRETKTDAAGRFVMIGVTKGTRLRAAAGRLETEQAIPVNGEETGLALVVMKVTPTTLKGRVTDASGNGIAGTEVVLNHLVGNYGFGGDVAKTDAQGNYAIPGLRLGESYRVASSAPRFGQAWADVKVARGEIEHAQPPLVLPVANDVFAGTVVDANDKPVAGVEVNVSGTKTQWQKCVTDADGGFSFADIVEGEKIFVQLMKDRKFQGGGTFKAGDLGARVVWKKK